MKKLVTLTIVLSVVSGLLRGQGFADPKLQNYKPASPTAFQFLKYEEMPVSEYTGIPNITIPIYQIQEDGVTVPISLSYHAAGIRVNQEASWVGLGWDLNASGTIVQEINDLDDYGVGVTRLRPDYNESPTPAFQLTKYQLGCAITQNSSWTSTIPIQEPKAFYAYNIYTAYYIPVNGNRDNPILGDDLSNSMYYDSEPDIFTASFLGHSIKFIYDFKNNQIVVLNNLGYNVSRNGDVYKIIVPSGDEFYFEINTTVNSYSTTEGGIGGSSSSQTLPSSRIWMLTKIITKNKRQILFNYSSTSAVGNFPSYSDKWDTAINPVSTYYSDASIAPQISAYSSQPLNGIARTVSNSSENKITLNSISFPKGEINFITSDRSDILGVKKLDAVQIKAANVVIKSFQFNYSYFDASGVGGNKFTLYNESSYGNTPYLRLKLTSLQDNSGALHTFTYDPTPLPAKNSLAQDFWGFYNGQLTNTSLIPNPARLSNSQVGTSLALPDNGNNNSARLSYAKAGILTDIKYPTGGKVSLEYELNQFDNYILPDYTTTTNTVTSGNGLRIHALNYQAVENTNSKRTEYTYSGGKALVPLQVGRFYTINSFQNGGHTGSLTSYQIIELNGRGFYSTNALASGNGLGYDKVIKKDVDGNGISLGRIETVYNNTPDDISNSANGSSQLSASLPAKKHLTAPTIPETTIPENGTVNNIIIYDNQNRQIRKVENFYVITYSDVFYGARFFSYGSMYYPTNCSSTSVAYFTSVPYTMVGYYPIYDFKNDLSSTKVTEYDENNNSIVTLKGYNYDAYGQISQEIINKSEVPGQTNGQVIYNYSHPSPGLPNTLSLLQANRLTEITNSKKTLVKGPANQYPQFIDFDKVENEYTTVGNKIVKSKTTITANPGSNAFPDLITYNKYDPDYANLLEFTNSGVTNSLIWDTDGEDLIAEIKNAVYDDVCYSSFEGTYSGNAGNWVLMNNSTIPDATSPTGKYCYNISGSNTLSKTNLNSGKAYVVSYWSKNGSYSVTGSIGIKTGKTINGWTYYEHKISNTTSVNISGTGSIDEVRLYPADAQMTSYTYIPLTGLQSQCDVRNVITYYEYDPFGRLVIVRDQDKNILKKICYNYAGQPENCTICTNFSPIWQNTATPLRCQLDATGQNTGYQEQEQVNVNTCCTINAPYYNDKRWVQVAQNTTSCPLPIYVNLTSTNTNSAPGFTASYYNTATGFTYNFTISTASGLQTLGTVPAGNYTLTISKPGSNMSMTFKSGCFKQTIVGTSATFFNVGVSTSTCNSITISNNVE